MAYQTGSLPVGTTGTFSVEMNGTIISGGSAIVRVTSSRTLDTLYIHFAGSDGYYAMDISGIVPVTAGGNRVYDVLLQLAQNLLSYGNTQISFSGSDAANRDVSPSASRSVNARQVGSMGKAMQISISWDTRYDLDLYVTPPASVGGGQTIYYGRRRVGNGELDLDANVGCGTAGSSWDIRNENIYFDALADGDYVVAVDRYSYCSPLTITNYAVSAYINGAPFEFSSSQVGQFAASTGRTRNTVGTIRITGGVPSLVDGGVVEPDAREINYGDRVEYGGETYETVVIGGKTWMASNLNYSAGGIGKCYETEESNCQIYGRLYDWATAMGLDPSCNTIDCEVSENRKGICPTGWHIPTEAEWGALVSAAGGPTVAGAKLRATSGWNTRPVDVAGTDDHGFSALPGGMGYSASEFENAGSSGFWWCADQDGGTFACSQSMNRNNGNATLNYPYKNHLYSVRCLKN